MALRVVVCESWVNELTVGCWADGATDYKTSPVVLCLDIASIDVPEEEGPGGGEDVSIPVG